MLTDPPPSRLSSSKTRGGGQLNFLLKKGGSAKFLVNLTSESQNFDVRFLVRWPPVGGQKFLGVLPLENNDLVKLTSLSRPKAGFQVRYSQVLVKDVSDSVRPSSSGQGANFRDHFRPSGTAEKFFWGLLVRIRREKTCYTAEKFVNSAKRKVQTATVNRKNHNARIEKVRIFLLG